MSNEQTRNARITMETACCGGPGEPATEDVTLLATIENKGEDGYNDGRFSCTDMRTLSRGLGLPQPYLRVELRAGRLPCRMLSGRTRKLKDASR